MTERIYSTDSYATDMIASVVKTDDENGRVLLDRTVFYPGGGGQPIDHGALVIGEDRLDVVRVTADRDGIWHWIEGGLPSIGTELRGEID